jgi:hypothetical protein
MPACPSCADSLFPTAVGGDQSLQQHLAQPRVLVVLNFVPKRWLNLISINLQCCSTLFWMRASSMDRYVAQKNIQRFKDLLELTQDFVERDNLRKLIDHEQERLEKAIQREEISKSGNPS